MASQKFLQNPFLECQWSASRAKKSFSPSESIYLMIWAKLLGRNRQSTRKLLRKNRFSKFLCIGFWWGEIFFALKTLHWHPRNGFWRNFWEANYFHLKLPQHSVVLLKNGTVTPEDILFPKMSASVWFSTTRFSLTNTKR